MSVPRPEITRLAEDFRFVWPQLSIRADLRDLANGRDGPKAEVTVSHDQVGHLHQANLNLMSTSSRQTFIKQLTSRDASDYWPDVVEQLCVLAVEAWRDGLPLELLEPEKRDAAGVFLVNPILPSGTVTLWFGDGSAGKSYLALAAMRALVLEQPIAGMASRRATPAYLDWEWDKDEHADRLLRLGGDAVMFYRRCVMPLADQVRTVGRLLDKNKVDLLVVDSLGMACGGDPADSEIVLRFFSALRTLGRTALVIHHVPKEKKEPFGSVYIRNSVRSAWYMLRSTLPEDGSFKLAMQHRKSNAGRLERNIGIQFAFDEAAYSTSVASTDPKSVPELAEGLSVRARILDYLADGKATLAAIVAAIDAPSSQVSSRLDEMKRRKQVTDIGSEWGLLTH